MTVSLSSSNTASKHGQLPHVQTRIMRQPWQLRFTLLGVLGLLLLCWTTDSLSETEPSWGVMPALGLFKPSLNELDKGEFKAPLPGRGRIIFPDTGVNIDFDFQIENPLSSIRLGAAAELGFFYVINPKHALLFGMGSWEATSTSLVSTEMPFQGSLTKTLYERSGNLSVFQYFVGWRWTFVRSERYRIRLLASLHELFDTDYREHLSFSFQSGEAAGFKRLITMSSQATGGELIRLGLAADYLFGSRFSLGLEGGYFYALRSFRLGNAGLKTDVQDQDNIRFRLPAIQDSNGQLLYLSGNNGFDSLNYLPLRLDFSGWGLMFRASIAFF